MEVCDLHKTIDAKLDRIIERQEENSLGITRLQDSVDNGLKTTVLEIVNHVATIRDRIEVLETFSWFREWVTQLRDNLFKNVLVLIGLAAITYFIINFGKQSILKIVGG